jgi:quercetin dioxygenase-like cupin family protein
MALGNWSIELDHWGVGLPVCGLGRFRMKDHKMKRASFLLSLALGATAMVSSAQAGTGSASTLLARDLPDFPGKEGMVELVVFAPGEVSEPHRHNADLFVYVLQGTVVTQVEGEAPKTLKAGETFYESPTDVHLVSRNASTTEPAKLLVFFVKNKGAPPTVLVPHEHK